MSAASDPSLEQKLVFDLDLIRRYNRSGPRYTSYPTAVKFDEAFAEPAYRAVAERTNAQSRTQIQQGGQPTPLSLYFHIPFCDTVCFYCGCNKIATKDRSKSQPYLDRVHKELAMQSALFDDNRVVDQLHWGGGTPTFISHAQMRELMAVTRQHFPLHDDDTGEYSIEIDPREVTPESIALLREIGFNRMSLGVQDFDAQVQKSVNRIQSEEQTFATLNAAKSEGFKSVSIDLIYGLPHQTIESFATTVDKIIAAGPDRLSVFNYAHLPEMFKPQRRINEDELPSASEKLDILQDTNERLIKAGYVYIGMDHFAKPDDELAVAQREHTLYRNFQGYSTHADCDLIGLGVTSIGKVGNTFSQNHKTLEAYYESIDAGQLAVYRGLELDDDDLLRSEVITRLICHFSLRPAEIEQRFDINFAEYFAQELEELQTMADDGLLKMTDEVIDIAPAGRLLIRNVCMVFDKYLRQSGQQQFSKVI
ncbi:MAG: oxygen-independent coproporphyrinogen III oxidase [Gammaproteobacteria bacterium]|nr:oxygen-independent coproporphyrinogen III oxidase [Gammaproteobacteria bacterium]MCF6259834.1 oxygen-independent coproporphyrinogen III oxidase [Gammaproteobacteria bacterium]